LEVIGAECWVLGASEDKPRVRASAESASTLGARKLSTVIPRIVATRNLHLARARCRSI
jgi:hypothetical protein